MGNMQYTGTLLPPIRPACQRGMPSSILTASLSSEGSMPRSTLMWVISPSGCTIKEHSTRPCIFRAYAAAGYVREALINCIRAPYPPGNVGGSSTVSKSYASITSAQKLWPGFISVRASDWSVVCTAILRICAWAERADNRSAAISRRVERGSRDKSGVDFLIIKHVSGMVLQCRQERRPVLWHMQIYSAVVLNATVCPQFSICLAMF